MTNQKMPWLIQYNPLYIVSAVCLLFGIYKINGALLAYQLAYTDQILSLISELYQLIVLGSVAFLAKIIKDQRSAHFLAGLGFILALDPTYQTEAFTGMQWAGYLSSILWVCLFMVKMKSYQRLLKVKIHQVHEYIILGGVILFVCTPHLLWSQMIDHECFKLIFVFFFHAVGAYLSFGKRRIKASGIESRILTQFVWISFALLLLRHIEGTWNTYNMDLSSHEIFAMITGFLYFMKQRKDFYVGCLVLLIVAHLHQGVAFCGFLVMAICLVRILKEKMDGAVVIFHIALFFTLLHYGEQFGVNDEVIYFLSSVGLLGNYLFSRKIILLSPLPIGVLYYLKVLWKDINSDLIQGVSVVGIGVFLLLSGLFLHWNYLKKKKESKTKGVKNV